MIGTTLANFINLRPSEEFIRILRDINVVSGIVAYLVLIFVLALPHWRDWGVSTRLMWLALLASCFTYTYGSFESKYLDTELRAPFATLSIFWALVASLWPKDSRKN